MATPVTHKRGRSTLLTDDIQDAIVQAIRAGSYLDDAAAYAGISYRTIFRWIERGKHAEAEQEAGNDITDDEYRYCQFWQAVEKARADAVIRNIGIIQSAAQNGSWQASAWYLERTNPKKWGRHDTVELTGKDGEPIQVEHSIKESLAEKFAAAERAATQVIDVQEVDQEPKQLKASNG